MRRKVFYTLASLLTEYANLGHAGNFCFLPKRWGAEQGIGVYVAVEWFKGIHWGFGGLSANVWSGVVKCIGIVRVYYAWH